MLLKVQNESKTVEVCTYVQYTNPSMEKKFSEGIKHLLSDGEVFKVLTPPSFILVGLINTKAETALIRIICDIIYPRKLFQLIEYVTLNDCLITTILY